MAQAKYKRRHALLNKWAITEIVPFLSCSRLTVHLDTSVYANSEQYEENFYKITPKIHTTY